MNTKVQGLKEEIELVKKTQIEENLEIKKLGTWAGAFKSSLTVEYKSWKWDSQALQTLQTKWLPQSRDLGH